MGAERLDRLWVRGGFPESFLARNTMLAHNQGGLLNAAQIARGLGVSGATVGHEIDLVLSWPDGREWAVEVKRSLAPKVERGLRSALADVEPERSFVVYPGSERYRLGAETWAIDLAGLCAEVAAG